MGIRDTTLEYHDKMINKIFRDSKGKLWISSNAGLFSYSNNTLTNVSKKAGIKSNFVSIGLEDKAGVLWLNSKEGLYTLNDGVAKKITDESIEIGKGIGSIAEDKEGKNHNKELTEFKNQKKIKALVFQIYKDKPKVMVCGFGGAYRLKTDNFSILLKWALVKIRT
ncbi:MAG: hypothetical protein IPO94_14045 [Saprospiraceae bacterium]|nr:hypothetical protein [Saprospiraceae bacterium]